MSQSGERYAKLIEIARETSSERRRDLLREVTDLFFESENNRSQVETKMFGELMAKVAFELDVEVRRELSSRFTSAEAPRDLAVALANDSIEVAAPVLRRSGSLTDDDLIAVVERHGDDHRLVVTQRDTVSEAVSAALVHHGGDQVVASLLTNEGARIGAETYQRVVERAETSPMLHAPAVRRQNIPPDVLNQLYLVVAAPMRKEILERNKSFSEEEIARAMERAQTRIGVRVGALPEDYEAAQRKVASMKARRELKPELLPALWRNKERTAFRIALADIVGLDYATVDGMCERADVDALALACRAAGFDRALFVTLAVFAIGPDGMKDAEVLGRMYTEVPVDAAQRAMRFMKVRAAAAQAA